MRPKPLIPTVIVMVPVLIAGSLAALAARGVVLRSGDVFLTQKGIVAYADGIRRWLDPRASRGRVSGSTDHERLAAGAAGVITPCAAVARRGARHRGELAAAVLVQRSGARHLHRLPPDTVHLADHEGLAMARAGAVGVGPACAAVA